MSTPFEHFFLSRRQLLRLGGSAAAAFAGASALPAMRVLNSTGPASDYKALVYVFLDGGADTLNLIVPTSAAEYGVYANSRGDLAEDDTTLLPISPTTPQGATWGLHRNVTGLQTLFQTGKLGILANGGPLVGPMTKAEYLDGQLPTPRHLFSHVDQKTQWMSAHADGPQRLGWAGRVLDLMQGANGTVPLPAGVCLEQDASLLRGLETGPYVIGASGTESLDLASEPQRGPVLNSFAKNKHALARELTRVQAEALEAGAFLGPRLAAGPDFAANFHGSALSQQLRMVARLIALRQQLGMTRQVFFVGMDGYDTHDSQRGRLDPLYADLSASLLEFQTVMESLGEDQNVTSLTHSEFGRTLSSNGQGSDHGWGGHSLVLGGAVQGGEIYGTMPDLAIDGASDVGQGRLLPEVGVDQIAATLAKWFGLPPAQIPVVFPNLANFAVSDLGFLG